MTTTFADEVESAARSSQMYTLNRCAILVTVAVLTCLTSNAIAQDDRIAVIERADDYELTVPVSRLVMNIPKEGWTQASSPNGGASRRYFYLEDKNRHLILSGWFEAQEEFPGMAKFWEGETRAWSKNKLPKPAQVAFRKIGGWDTVVYQMPRTGGSNVNIRAHWLQAGTWIDLHISVDSDATETENTKRLEALLAGIRVSEKPSTSVMQYLSEGSAYYVRHDFARAIGPYSKALELEKKTPTLDSSLWRVLIDNLGMAYGVSGNLQKAKETFEYGLSKDKAYPMFYYNLACTYAEMNDVDNAIVNLKLAFKNRDGMITGEQIPDPATDDSFQRFMRNERFLDVLRELGTGPK
jgi:tetratricopeptide (TPR) repeat protein